MKLSKKLQEWQEQSFIDNATAQKITEYEKQRAKPLILWALGGLGSFSIIVGLISVIAANWLYIPDHIKLATDLIACIVIAIALYKTIASDDKGVEKLWIREVLIIFYYGFTLASMALIGQTYQLGGSVAKLFLVWSIATIPLALLGRGKFLAVLWLIGSATTYILNIESLHDYIRSLTHSHQLTTAIFLSAYLLGPLIFLLISRIPWLVKNRAITAAEFSKFSWLAIMIFGWMSQFLWYEKIVYGHQTEALYIVGICFIATIVTTLFIPRLYSEESNDTQLSMRVILVSVFILGASGIWHQQNLDLIGALTNLLYMCVLAWAALKIKSTTLFNIVTALICIRILAIYFEVFGSMLETGIGLVFGGTLTLLIAWLWLKKSEALAQRLGLNRGSYNEK
jgi:uncharacterized membrane protein